MKNALVYSVNGNQHYVDCVVNSINSFFENNKKELTDTVHVFIFCPVNGINLSYLNPNVKYTIVNKFTYNYFDIKLTDEQISWLSYASLFRFEIFHNPIFLEFDNVLYLDSDTVIYGDLSEMFFNPVKKISLALDCQDVSAN